MLRFMVQALQDPPLCNSTPFISYFSPFLSLFPVVPFPSTIKFVTSFSFHFQFSTFKIFSLSHLSGILSLSYLSYFVLLSQHSVFFHSYLSHFLSVTHTPCFPPLLLCTFLSFDLSYYFHIDLVPLPFTLPICPDSFHSPHLFLFLSLSPFFPFPFTLLILSLSPMVSFPFTLLICSLSFHFYSIGRCECLQKRCTET
jgi:hypothetical protein